MRDEDSEPKEGEVLGPTQASPEAPIGDNYIALISQYTERPDLLIGELEKHDPGFTKRMNEQAEQRATRMSNARFWFGGVQAYLGLGVSVLAALVTLGLVAYAVVYGQPTFWLIISLAVFYAITQGGPSGFEELCRGVAAFFRKDGNRPD